MNAADIGATIGEAFAYTVAAVTMFLWIRQIRRKRTITAFECIAALSMAFLPIVLATALFNAPSAPDSAGAGLVFTVIITSWIVVFVGIDKLVTSRRAGKGSVFPDGFAPLRALLSPLTSPLQRGGFVLLVGSLSVLMLRLTNVDSPVLGIWLDSLLFSGSYRSDATLAASSYLFIFALFITYLYEPVTAHVVRWIRRGDGAS